MNRFVRALVGLAVALSIAGSIVAFLITPSASAATGDLTITTRGWGHGVGMSQWGAWAAAREGVKYDEILAFYYPGTQLTKYEADTTVKVRLTTHSSSAWTYYRVDLKPVETFARLVMHTSAGDRTKVLAVGVAAKVLCKDGKVTVDGVAGAFDWVEVRPASEEGRVGTGMYATSSTGTPFANEYWGIIRVQPNSQVTLRLQNIVQLDKYVGGISEIDTGWARPWLPEQYAPEAVKAQQTAARTYAMAKGGAEMLDNTYDQVYGGYNYEVANPGVPEASAATAGMVITLGGTPITAFYCSSSGGYLSNSAWSNTPPAYIVAKPDPWSLKAPVPPWRILPGYTESHTFSPATLASKLGTNVGTITKIEVTERDTSDPGSHARTVKITGTGGSTTMAATTFKSRLSLRSTLIASITGGPTPPLPRFEQTDKHLKWTGTWETFSKTGPSAGSYKRTNTLTSSCTVTFNGTYLAWIATKGTTMGKAWVSLDGGAATLVDLAESVTDYQESVWNTGTVASGRHTVKIWWYERNTAGKYVSVDAFDVKGTLEYPPTSSLTRYEQTDQHLLWVGTWATFFKSPGPSGGHYTRANTATASCTVTFNGTYLAWIATKGTTLGKARVSVDGGSWSTVDLAASSTKYQQKVWDTGTLSAGVHAVKIWWYEKNVAGKYISVDAFDVKGTLQYAASQTLVRYQQTDTHLDWTGTWYTFTKTPGPSGGSYKRANTSGASCTATFYGTYLAWIATKGTTLGKAWVSLDDGTPKLIDLARSSVLYAQSVWNTGNLSLGTHKVKIWWYEKNIAGKYISVDAFDVRGSLK